MSASASVASVSESSYSPTSDTFVGTMSGLLPDAWARAIGGGYGRTIASTGRKPRVVPLKFQTNHVRKQYRLKRDVSTWAKWFNTHKSTLLIIGGVLLLVLILYLKWQDAQARRAAAAEKKNRATSLQSLPSTPPVTPRQPSLVPVVSSGPYN